MLPTSHQHRWTSRTSTTSLGQKLYLAAIAIQVDEPRTRNVLRPYRRDSSQHQEFELNQPTSTPPLHVPSISNVLVILRGPTSQDIYDKINHPGIVSSHVFDQMAISGPLNSHAHSVISLCAYDTIWSTAHRHIQMYFPHMMNIIKWQEEATSTSKTLGRTSAIDTEYFDIDNQHHAQQGNHDYNQVQTMTTSWRLTDIIFYIEKTSASQHPTSLTVTSDGALSYLVQQLSTFATAHPDLYIRERVGLLSTSFLWLERVTSERGCETSIQILLLS